MALLVTNKGFARYCMFIYSIFFAILWHPLENTGHMYIENWIMLKECFRANRRNRGSTGFAGTNNKHILAKNHTDSNYDQKAFFFLYECYIKCKSRYILLQHPLMVVVGVMATLNILWITNNPEWCPLVDVYFTFMPT